MPPTDDDNSNSKEREAQKPDIAGMLSFILTMTTLLLLLDASSANTVSSRQPLVITYGILLVFFAAVLVIMESCWAMRPMIPIPLLVGRKTGPYYLIQVLLLCGQLTVSKSAANE